MQAFTPGASFSSTAIGTAPQPAVAETAAPRGTQPLQQQPAASSAAFQTQASPRAALDSAVPGDAVPNKTVPLQQVPEPPLDPANTTAPLPPQARAADDARASSLPPIQKSISAGELFLVIATCGIYGIVRMLRRKEP
jgi:hypothetical protein